MTLRAARQIYGRARGTFGSAGIWLVSRHDPGMKAMETLRTDYPIINEAVASVSWASIAAGAVAIAALSLALFALGAGLGLSSISPWAGSGVSASTFTNATGIYLVVVAVMSSAVGGYLAARMRTKWVGVHTN